MSWSVTDNELREALVRRAASVGPSAELLTDVVELVRVRPQTRRGLAGLGHGRSMPLLVGIALLLGTVALAAVVGARLMRPGPGGVVAYTTGTFSWNGAPAVEDVGIAATVGGSPPRRIATVPGDTQTQPRFVTTKYEPAPVPTVPQYPFVTVIPYGTPFPTPEPEPEQTAAEQLIDVSAGPAIKWSPDGRLIAFRLYNDARGLYVMNRDGSDLRKVAEATGEISDSTDRYNSSFDWSPDSSRLAFITPNNMAWPPGDGRNGELHSVDVDSGRERTISAGAMGSIAWSPDGSRLAFGRGNGSVVVVSADGSGERTLPSTGYPGGIAWSPDGSLIAFEQERFRGCAGDSCERYPEDGSYLTVVDPELTAPRVVDYLPMAGCCWHGAFGGIIDWSLDGTSITRATWLDDSRAIRTVDVDSGAVIAQFPGDWFTRSPDGAQMVFAVHDRLMAGAPMRLSSIYLVNADGSNRLWLADGNYPAWAPDAP